MVFSRQCCLFHISWVDEQLHLPLRLYLSLTTYRSIQAQIYKQWFCHLVIIADREIKYWFSSQWKRIAVQKLPILPLSCRSQAVSAVTFYLRNLWLILTLMAFAAYEDEGVHFFQNEAPNVTVIHAQCKNRPTRENMSYNVSLGHIRLFCKSSCYIININDASW